MDQRLEYLLYRCFSCGRLITKYEMLAGWEAAEKSQEDRKGVCPCGAGQVRPTNAKLWEELLLPRVWRVWLQDIVLPWARKKTGL